MATALGLASNRLNRRELLRLGMMGTAVGLTGSIVLSDTEVAGAAGSGDKGPCGLIEPGAGAWKTWVISSGSAIRVPPPPSQAATAAEIRQLVALAAARDPNALDSIRFWDAGSPTYRWVEYAVPYIIGP